MLVAALGQARARRPRMILLDGPTGMGKTALLRAFVRQAAPLPVLWASGDEGESTLAYGVVDQLRVGC